MLLGKAKLRPSHYDPMIMVNILMFCATCVHTNVRDKLLDDVPVDDASTIPVKHNISHALLSAGNL